jgi:hypothetical protein
MRARKKSGIEIDRGAQREEGEGAGKVEQDETKDEG